MKNLQIKVFQKISRKNFKRRIIEINFIFKLG